MDYILITLLGVLVILTIVFLTISNTKKESFTASDEDFSVKLSNLIRNKPSYLEYLNFLIDNKNKSVKLTTRESYNTLMTNYEYSTKFDILKLI